MAFPTALPSYLGFTASHTLLADSHAAQHNQEQADIVALATKVGTGSSTPTNNKILRGNGTGTSTWGQVDLTTDVTSTLPIANGGTGAASAAGAASNLMVEMGKLLFPIGCIYTEITGINPTTTFGFGVWTAFGAGRVLVGDGTSDQAFTAGATGGESSHTLTSNEMPSHTHIQDAHTHPVPARDADDAGTAAATRGTDAGVDFPTRSTTATNQNTGGGASHNNLQPYIVVYFWKRTA